MKFHLHNIRGTAGRFATLSNLGHHGDVSMDTPGCLLYTRSGSAPNLSHVLLSGIEGVPPIIQVPLPTVIESIETLEAFGGGVAAFIGQPGSVVCTSIQDPGKQSPSGYNDRKSVSVWAPAGRNKLTAEAFLSSQEALQADLMEALCDGDTPAGASPKRVKKAVDRTLAFLDQCLSAKVDRQKLQNTEVLGVIEGGESIEERLRSARETAKRAVSGFVLDGFHNESMDDRARWSIMNAVLNEIPEDKPRFVHGVGRPDEVLRAVELGVDIFDSTFPYEVTERGCALVFSHTPSMTSLSSQPDDEDSRHAGASATSVEDSSRLHGEGVQNNERGLENGGDVNSPTMYEMKLSEERYVDDFSALVEGCPCYCCTNHTRAYINHLINVKELLAGVLLMIHNLHHYFGFFRSIRLALRDGTMQQLKTEINKTR